jgi:hypothetical protein
MMSTEMLFPMSTGRRLEYGCSSIVFEETRRFQQLRAEPRLVDGFDRREFLERAGRLTLAAGTLAAMPARAGRLQASTLDRRLRELARELDGSVVAPGSAAYPSARLLVNTRFDRVRPHAIVFCETAKDVQTTVRWARKYRIHIVPRGGGHSYGGYSTTSGVVVDLSRMGRIRVDAARNVAVVGAGARLIDVYSALYAQDFVDVVAQLHANGTARETIRKTLGRWCDGARPRRRQGQAGARDQAAAEEAEQINPPCAAESRPSTGASRRSTSWRCSARLVGRARFERRPHARRRLRRVTPARAFARGNDEDAARPLGRAASGTGGGARDEFAAPALP